MIFGRTKFWIQTRFFGPKKFKVIRIYDLKIFRLNKIMVENFLGPNGFSQKNSG